MRAAIISVMNPQRILAWLLRLAGVTEILAFIAVVMPRSWMDISHTWLGMGVMPDGPLIMFMIRQASYVYGMHGVSLLVISSNVVRFRALVILNGIAYLLAGPIFFWIDYTTGVPWWWMMVDSIGCGFTGAAILALDRINARHA